MKLNNNSPINFVEDIFHYLSPFSAHQIEYNGETFATLEHAYQSSKFKQGDARDEIKSSKSPMDAWRISQKHKQKLENLQDSFDKDKVMRELMIAKIKQHPDIKRVLQLSKSRGLLKVYPTDYYWGTGADGSGKNKMGKMWMEIRDEVLED